MFQNDPCKVLTDEVRLSYVHINEAYASPSTPGATPKFSVSLLIPKTNTALVEQIKAAIRAAAQTAASSQWGGFCLPETALFSVLHDGDGVNQSGKPYGPEAKGCYVLGACTIFLSTSKHSPAYLLTRLGRGDTLILPTLRFCYLHTP